MSIRNCNLVFRCGGSCSLAVLDNSTADVQETVVNASQQHTEATSLIFKAMSVHNSVINAPRF